MYVRMHVCMYVWMYVRIFVLYANSEFNQTIDKQFYCPFLRRTAALAAQIDPIPPPFEMRPVLPARRAGLSSAMLNNRWCHHTPTFLPRMVPPASKYSSKTRGNSKVEKYEHESHLLAATMRHLGPDTPRTPYFCNIMVYEHTVYRLHHHHQ